MAESAMGELQGSASGKSCVSEDGSVNKPDNKGAVAGGHDNKKGKRKAAIVVVVIALLACIGGVVFYLLVNGTLAPIGAAAKYSLLSYIEEDDVTDYIMTYKEQMGYADSSDDEWASFLADYNLTPARLRYSTVEQMIKDNLIEDWGKRLGITVDDSDLDAYIQSMRGMYAFDDDELWGKTLERYGRTEEQLRDTYRHALVKQRVFTEEVPLSKVNDDLLQQYLFAITSGYDSSTVKHSYCFKIVGLDEDGSFDKRKKVEYARQALVETGVDKANFEALTTTLSNVDSLVDTGGANGWSCDTASYSFDYLQALETTEVGELSEIFVDGDGYAFIWVDESVDLPETQEAASSYDVSSLPESLHDYLADSVAYMLWKQDCGAWLTEQVSEANVILFPMPADVPYYVEMEVDEAGNPITK